MNFKIKQQNQEPNQDIEFWLEEDENKVWLKGRDKTGVNSILMVFRNGKFLRGKNVRLQGLETDEKGRIEEENA